MTTTKPSTFTLRVAQPADDWAVRKLFYALHAYNASLDPRFELADGWPDVLGEHLAHVRATNRGVTLLAWKSDEPVGLIMMHGHVDSPLFRHRRWAELLALYVDPSARGSLLAKRLLGAGLDWAREHGYERVQLYVTASNERAKRFYASAGFAPVQEIWRLELGPRFALPDANGVLCDRRRDHLLSINPHQLGVDENETEPDEVD